MRRPGAGSALDDRPPEQQPDEEVSGVLDVVQQGAAQGGVVEGREMRGATTAENTNRQTTGCV